MEAKSRTETPIGATERQRLHTIGYERLAPEELILALQANSVEVLVDVRQRAASRTSGFAKKALAASVTEAGIEYIHFPKLGTPQQLRSQFRAGSIEIAPYLSLYKRYLADQEASIVELEPLVTGKRCCLLCLEADHGVCHRTVLANLLVERSGGQISVHHISIER